MHRRLQLGIGSVLLVAAVADAAPEQLHGTAFGIYDLAIGITTFFASAGAGLLWTIGGPALTFSIGAAVAAATVLLLAIRPMPVAAHTSP